MKEILGNLRGKMYDKEIAMQILLKFMENTKKDVCSLSEEPSSISDKDKRHYITPEKVGQAYQTIYKAVKAVDRQQDKNERGR